jgi:hypothetical protein
MKLKPSDPAYFLLDNVPPTPITVYRQNCYICNDSEFSRMGMPTCKRCPKCKNGHIAADDTVCDLCGHDEMEEYYKGLANG